MTSARPRWATRGLALARPHRPPARRSRWPGPHGRCSPSALIARLRCEYLENPLGIDTAEPRPVGSSNQNSGPSGESPTRSSSPARKPISRRMPETYGTPARCRRTKPSNCLTPANRCCHTSAASGSSTSTTCRAPPLASRHPGRWACWPRSHGHWISLAPTTDTNSTPAPMLRRAFTLGKHHQTAAPVPARLLRASHSRKGRSNRAPYDPGYTRYDKRDLYVTYDVTDAVQQARMPWASFSAPAG